MLMTASEGRSLIQKSLELLLLDLLLSILKSSIFSGNQKPFSLVSFKGDALQAIFHVIYIGICFHYALNLIVLYFSI